jgi:hypothetical protein
MAEQKRIPPLARQAFGRRYPARLVGFSPLSFEPYPWKWEKRSKRRRLLWANLRPELRKCRDAFRGGNPIGLYEAIAYCAALHDGSTAADLRLPKWIIAEILMLLQSDCGKPAIRAKIRAFAVDARRFLVVEWLREAREELGSKRWGRGRSFGRLKRQLNRKIPAGGSLFERAEAYLKDEDCAGSAEQIARSWRRVYRYLHVHDGRPGPYFIPHFWNSRPAKSPAAEQD